MGIPAKQPDQERSSESVTRADGVTDFGGDCRLAHRFFARNENSSLGAACHYYEVELSQFA